VLPGITDTLPQVHALARALKKTGGRFAHPSPLRLYPALHSGFLPIIKEHFPELYPKYRRAYRGTGAAPKRYTAAVVKRFRDVAAEIGVPVKDSVLEGGAYRPRAVTISLPSNPDVESYDNQRGFWA
jgi:hypothetical protein